MTDQALITQFQNGDSKEAAFTQLVKSHQTQVYYQIKKMVLEHADADDIAQAVWIKVWNKLDGFKQKAPLALGYSGSLIMKPSTLLPRKNV